MVQSDKLLPCVAKCGRGQAVWLAYKELKKLTILHKLVKKEVNDGLLNEKPVAKTKPQ